MMSPLASGYFTTATTLHLSALPTHSHGLRLPEGSAIFVRIWIPSQQGLWQDHDCQAPPLHHPPESIAAGIYKSDEIDVLPNPESALLALHRHAISRRRENDTHVVVKSKGRCFAITVHLSARL